MINLTLRTHQQRKMWSTSQLNWMPLHQLPNPILIVDIAPEYPDNTLWNDPVLYLFDMLYIGFHHTGDESAWKKNQLWEQNKW